MCFIKIPSAKVIRVKFSTGFSVGMVEPKKTRTLLNEYQVKFKKCLQQNECGPREDL